MVGCDEGSGSGGNDGCALRGGSCFRHEHIITHLGQQSYIIMTTTTTSTTIIVMGSSSSSSSSAVVGVVVVG